MTSGPVHDHVAELPPSSHSIRADNAAFEQLIGLLREANKTVNLTAIRETDAMRTLHVADSLALAWLLPELLSTARSLVDIGTGGGFPLLPLAIARPELRAVGIDSVAKKLRFVEAAAASLGLANVTTIHGRAEEVARDPAHRERHGLAASRAVGPVASLLEVSLPLLEIGGHAVLYKTTAAIDELPGLLPVVEALGGDLQNVLRYSLGPAASDRALVVVRKVRPTPKKFPRNVGIPFHKPLQSADL